MYEIIGTVEHVTPRGGGHLWMDEDGKYHDLEINEEATRIFHEAGGLPSDFIVGTVILETPERKAKRS